MARIALIAGVVAGSIALALATGGASVAAEGSFWGALIGGAATGLAAGTVLANLIFPPKYGGYPTLNDYQVDSSAPGVPIPFGYGGYRLAGAVIWATKIKEHSYQQSQGGKGGPSVKTFYYTVDAAISFGYGPGSITRLWADSKLVYDATGKGPISIDTGITHSNGRPVTTPFRPVIYPGTATQLPDPTIQAALGVNSTPAFRDQIYIVLNDFPLSDFGNRLPNFRAEITSATELDFIKDLYPGTSVTGQRVQTPNTPTTPFIDQLNRVAYVLDNSSSVAQKIDLDVTTGTPLDPWSAGTVRNFGDQILDSNGNVQAVYTLTSDHKSGASEPTWATGEGNTTLDHNVRWINVGPGPTAAPIVKQAQLTSPDILTLVGAAMAGGIDSSGAIWNCGTKVDGNAYLVRYDQNSFAQTTTILLPFATNFALEFAQFTRSGVTGKSYLYGITQQGASGSFIVVDLTAKVIVANGAWIPAGTAGWGNVGCPPCIDPSTGIAYVLASIAGTPVGTGVSIINPLSGIFSISSFVLSSAWQSTSTETGKAIYWDASDSTLIIVGSLGTVVKVDATTGAILAINKGVLGATGGNSWAAHQKGYYGLVPSDGILKLPTQSQAYAYIRTSDCALVNTVALSNWLPAIGGGDSVLNFGYDALTNSALVTFSVSTAYSTFTARLFFDRQKVAEEALSDVITDVWSKTGAPANLLDVSKVTGVTVRGYPVSQVTSAKAILTPLCAAYFFDFVETDNKLTAVPRGQSVSTIVPESDLGLIEDGAEAQPKIMQEHDLPLVMTVDYYDPATDYQQAKQMFKRNKRVKSTRNQSQMALPLTLAADEAGQLAARALLTAWAERNAWDFKLWRASYLILDPTDVIQFTYKGNPYQVRLIKTSAGQNNVLAITAVGEDPRQYEQSNAGSTNDGFIPSGIQPLGPTVFFVLDTPFISDSDNNAPNVTGFYWLMSSPLPGQWPGATFYNSPDNNLFNEIGSSTVEASYGTILVATPAPKTLFSWDFQTTINVQMAEGALSGDTMLNVLNGSNWFYLGGEIMAFVNATLNADGSYTLSTLLRGLRGTEGFCGTHIAGETMIMLTRGPQLQRTTEPTAFINAPQYFRGITMGLPVSGAASQEQILQGNDLKPYAPAQFQASIDGSHNMNISWVRRTRIGGAWLDGTETVPLSEESELYNLYIYDPTGTTIKRSILGLNTPSYTYTSAQQITDFGSNQTSVYGIVYQVSAAVGQGFPATNPTLGKGIVSGGSDATSILGVGITGTPADGDILQYDSGTNTWKIVGPLLKRQTITKTTGTLGSGSVENGTLAIPCKSFALLQIEVSGAARVELYSTAAFQSADSGRAFGTPPASGSQNGIICDFGLTQVADITPNSWICSPPLLGANGDGTPAQQVYYTITNMTGGSAAITVTITIVPIES